MAEKFKFMLPSTFDEYAASASACDRATFQPHSGGVPICIDHVAVSLDVAVARRSAYVERAIPTGSACEDHWPTMLSVIMPSTGAGGYWRRRRLPYDKAKLDDPECQEHFGRILDGMPVVPYAVEPSTHLHVVNCFIAQAMTRAFPKSPASRRQPYITPATFEVVVEAGRARKIAWKMLACLRKATLVQLLRFWRGQVPPAKLRARIWRVRWHACLGFASPKH
eukprot:5818653-Karenia_brevis.AAC.1